MRHNTTPAELTATAHDLLVVGGGIHGAWAAWDAALRGLSVALIDQGEFGAATSANSLRIVHGGLRYLARGDLARMRESVAERATLLRVAPGLVAPLPVLVPTYRRRGTGRLALGAALALNDLLSWRRNRGLAAEQAIPNSRVVSAAECGRLFPAVERKELTGGVIWYDGQLLDPVRLTASLVAAAERRGAIAVRGVRADRLLRGGRGGDRTPGVVASVGPGGCTLEIRAKTVLITAGPWSRALAFGRLDGDVRHSPAGHSFAMNIRLRRRLADTAVGLYGGTSHRGRYFFLVPDGESMLAGTWYALPDGSDERTLVARGAEALLAELNATCPAAALSPADVIGCQSGWLPLENAREARRADALADRPSIVNIGGTGGSERVVMVEGVKYTTARRVAARAVDQVMAMLGRPRGRCRTAELPL